MSIPRSECIVDVDSVLCLTTVLCCTVLSTSEEARPGSIHPPKVDLCGESHGPHETECRLLPSLLRHCVESRLHTESSSHGCMTRKTFEHNFLFQKNGQCGICLQSKVGRRNVHLGTQVKFKSRLLGGEYSSQTFCAGILDLGTRQNGRRKYI